MWQHILYRGPSRQVLHERYAKQGRIDEQAPIQTASDVLINAPIAEVWTLLIKAALDEACQIPTPQRISIADAMP
jgi:hypothetical protein